VSASHRELRFGGRAVLALPAAPRRVRLAALTRYRADTWKKRAFRAGVGAAIRLGVDGAVARPISCALGERGRGFDFESWWREVGDAVGSRHAAVVWPAQPDRGRAYVHLLDERGRAVGFAKLSLDEANDGPIRNEARALETLTAMGPRTFRVPRVISVQEIGDRAAVVVEPLPDHARPSNPARAKYPGECVAEYAGDGGAVPREALRDLTWWRRLESRGDELAVIARKYCEQGPQAMRVRRVHGDLGPGNLLCDNGERWIVDWEGFDERGPRLTDPVNWTLARAQAAVLRDAEAGVLALEREFPESRDETGRWEVLASLLYLAGEGIAGAERVVGRWKAE